MEINGNSIVRVETGFAFEGHPVRVELFDKEPWWAACDVAEALGYSDNSRITMLCDKVPEEWRGVKPFDTKAGIREIIALSEQGLYFFLARSNMAAALPFQKWIAGEVLPSIRRTGSYGVKQTPAEMLLASVQMLVDQERRLRASEVVAARAEVIAARTEQRVEAIEARAAEHSEQLKGIVAPDGDARAVSTRMMISRVVRAYCIATTVDYSEAYGALYREFRDRFGVNLTVRARNRGIAPLDLAEADGYLDSLHAVAYEIFVKNNESKELAQR